MHFDFNQIKTQFINITEHGLDTVTEKEFDAAVAQIDIAILESQVEAEFNNWSIREVEEADTFNGLTLAEAKQVWLNSGPAFWDGNKKLALMLNGETIVYLCQFVNDISELNPKLKSLKQERFNDLIFNELVAKIMVNRNTKAITIESVEPK